MGANIRAIIGPNSWVSWAFDEAISLGLQYTALYERNHVAYGTLEPLQLNSWSLIISLIKISLNCAGFLSLHKEI
jgi:hypothetical protein